jgi:hypothetical protein
MADDDNRPEHEPEPAQPPRSAPPPSLLEPDSPLHGMIRAFKIFLVPFIISWALAWIGSESQLDWMYYTGLGGVGASMLFLMVWLIR